MNKFFYIIFFNDFFYDFIKFFIIVRNFFIYTTFYNSRILIAVLQRFQINLYLKINYLMSGFVYYKFFFKIGLGFRKKFYITEEFFIIYVGGRH